MKQRAARHRDRGLMVNRAGAWGAVLYVRKRAYYWGHHCPADALGIVRTAMASQAKIHLNLIAIATRNAWNLKTPAEVRADIKALFD